MVTRRPHLTSDTHEGQRFYVILANVLPIFLLQSLGIDTKNGRKRQYAFVAKLFREHDLDIEEVHEIIRASKDGTIQAAPIGASNLVCALALLWPS